MTLILVLLAAVPLVAAVAGVLWMGYGVGRTADLSSGSARHGLWTW